MSPRRHGITVVAVLVLLVTGGCNSGDKHPEPPDAAATAESDKSTAEESPRGSEQESAAADSPTEGKWTNSLDMRFRVVPAGDLTLEAPWEGSLDQLSAREQFIRKTRGDPPLPPSVRRPARVTRPYSISVCEVTHAEFQKVMNREVSQQGEQERPIGVSWDEAVEFCQKLSQLPEEKRAGRMYRLPTQAEWQLAEVETCYPWHLTTRHVSVWNWCLDLYDSEYYRALPEDAPTLDPKGAESGSTHVVMRSYSHPDPFRRLMAFRVVAESGFPGEPEGN